MVTSAIFVHMKIVTQRKSNAGEVPWPAARAGGPNGKPRFGHHTGPGFAPAGGTMNR